jgi:hypothetical protein
MVFFIVWLFGGCSSARGFFPAERRLAGDIPRTFFSPWAARNDPLKPRLGEDLERIRFDQIVFSGAHAAAFSGRDLWRENDRLFLFNQR